MDIRRWLEKSSAAIVIAAVGVAPLLGASTAAAADEPVTPMVVGGSDPTEPYTFIVSLQQVSPVTGQLKSYCGGALIAPDAVVTASHCGENFKAGVTTVRVGSHQWAEGGQPANIVAIDLHPAYVAGGQQPGNDVAVVRLDRDVTTKTIKPIKIAASPGKVGDELRVIGYGATCNYGDPQWPCYPAGLQQADLEHVSDNLCSYFDRSVELCMRGKNGQMACFGDSGGPLLKKGKDRRWELVGIVRGDGDAQQEDLKCSDGLGIFTDATKYAPWIKRTAAKRIAPPVQQDSGTLTALKRPTEIEYTLPYDPGYRRAIAGR